MLYVLLQVSFINGFELVSASDRFLPFSTCIDDERDTKRGTDVWGTCFDEYVF